MKLGQCKPGLEPTTSPTTGDIRQAVGFYEGEGTCVKAHGRGDGVTARAYNTHCEPLDWMRSRFGGSVYPHVRRRSSLHKTCYCWAIHGPRARGFLMTIYQFLSPYRKAQIRRVLAE